MSTIPDKAVIETFVRGASIDAIKEMNKTVNRAFASGALALGTSVSISDFPGCMPLINDVKLKKLMCGAAKEIFPEEHIVLNDSPSFASTDMGDLSCIMRVVQSCISGVSGNGHSGNFYVTDPYTACVMSAEVYVMAIRALLENGAEKAKDICNGPAPVCSSKEEFIRFMDGFFRDLDMVEYTDSGALIKY